MDDNHTQAIACTNLAVGYRGEVVLSDISFTVPSGSTLAIVGRSGCGKSTMLKTLAGILPPLGGQASVLAVDLPAIPPAGTVGYIPQGLGLVPHETVLQNVLCGRLAGLGPVRSLLGRFPKTVRMDAADAIDRVGLQGKHHVRVKELSGGQRRRVAIARAFVQRPQVLLADEMLSELDHETAASIVRCLADLQTDTTMTVVVVEHDIDVANRIADAVLAVDGDGVDRTELAVVNT